MSSSRVYFGSCGDYNIDCESASPSKPSYHGPYYSLMVDALLLFLAGILGLIPCLIPSTLLSLHFAHKQVLQPRHRPYIVVFSVVEILSWIVALLYLAYYLLWPVDAFSSSLGLAGVRLPWHGVVPVAIIYSTALLFGTPRIVLTWLARNNTPIE
eukprot:TRINITY_DN3988_c0_g2_i1.p1 TRINITY_DN3988_c0_g2~~TRINITY_DN3988_c0_g2_i1.p1  ORF type:complete len:155 (-),score=15.18 TRINITY_DN3988_c0_g2_i1:70-534(-)